MSYNHPVEVVDNSTSSSSLESFVTFLMSTHLLDNSEESETLSKFLNLYDQFEDQQQQNDNNSSLNDYDQANDSQLLFETRAIFTLADFLKALSANEYYDIAQKLYNQWFDQENKRHFKALEKVVKIRQKLAQNDLSVGFARWKQMKEFQDLVFENEKLRDYIHQLTRENDNLSQERNILELQTKKRNQISINSMQIRPLRQSRKTSMTQRSSNQKLKMTQSLRGTLNESDSIHDRLHREAYQKNQQQVMNDLFKQQDELKNCTFKPNMSLAPPVYNDQLPVHFSARASTRREDPFLYERLSKSTKKFNPELLQLQKENEEMKDCTFQPETNSKSKQIVQQYSVNGDREMIHERLYKESESKDKFKKSLQRLKDQAEVQQCTFQPEINSNKNQSMMSSARKMRQDSMNYQEDTFNRLHHQYEEKQRSLVRRESEQDQKFKESHPFHPIRVTKQQDPQRRETSQQRAARMYDEWKEKDRKIQEKRNELLKEEEKLCKLTMATSKYKAKRPSIDHQTSFNSGLSPRSTQPPQHQTITDNSIVNQSNHSTSTHQNPHDRLYTLGKEKQRKQEELRDKVYRESGFSFAPQTNPQNPKFTSLQDKTVIDRNRDFLQKKETHIKEIYQQTQCDFKPQRITTKSKLAKNYENHNEVTDQENLGDKLHQRGAQIEQRKEKQRQEMAVDRNCTFRPQLAKKTDKILRESSAQRNATTGSNQSKSTTSLVSQGESKQPFTNRTNHNFQYQ